MNRYICEPGSRVFLVIDLDITVLIDWALKNYLRGQPEGNSTKTNRQIYFQVDLGRFIFGCVCEYVDQ